MKFTSTTLTLTALVSSTSAFTPVNTGANAKTSLSMSDRPIFSPPDVLDGELPGDYRFDPFNFAKNKQDLKLYRESEVRHARLAMLAAIGWPLSELLDGKIAAALDLPAQIGPDDLAPAVLNGNLDNVNPLFFVAALTLGAVVESQTLFRNFEPRMIGDTGFDPLNAYPSDPKLQRDLQVAEINNGRLAMLAITGYALAEYVTKVGVIDSTPQFF